MNENVISVKKICLILLAVYLVCAAAFCSIAQYQINYTAEEEVYIGEEANTNLGEVTDGMVIKQVFKPALQYIRGISIRFSTFGRENQGIINLSIVNGDTVIWEDELEAAALKDNSWVEFRFDNAIKTEGMGELGLLISTNGSNPGSAVTIGCQQMGISPENVLILNDEPVSDMGLCLKVVQNNDSIFAPYYIIVLLAGFVLLAIYCLVLIIADKKGRDIGGLQLINAINKYNFLLKQLVSRDFKTKYKRSVLGVFWSFLNPLLTMLVQYAVFSRLFKFDIENYPVYLLTGIVFFNNFNDSTNQAMMAIVGNAQLITKVYVPKYIYPISKVLSTSINLLFSMLPLLIVAIITGVKLTWALLLLPIGIILFLLFTIGIAFAVSAAMVFFRDIQFLWGVFIMIWMYATPIIYPIDILKGSIIFKLQQLNPMYHFITFFRTIVIEGVSPEPLSYVICIGFTVLSLLVGGLIFKRTQDRFVLYI